MQLCYRLRALISSAALLMGISAVFSLLPFPSFSQEFPAPSRTTTSEKETKATEDEQEVVMSFEKTVLGVEVTKAIPIAEVIGKVSDKRIVYAGEHHDEYEDHLVQLEIIKGLFAGNKTISIGMEMFQTPFQKALDDYIAGKMNEREFLKASEYFKRWGFDYNLYKDILRFAREKKIPLVALNMRKEIVDKVSKNGMASLSEEEKKELPRTMDMTDEDYKKRLREVFETHPDSEDLSFENFYQSQIIWDETMAQSVDDYLGNNPDRQMVVMAGEGHISHGSGIPKRTFRRNGLDYAVVLCNTSVEKDIADFVIYPKAEKAPSTPKLGVVLKDDNGRVKILGFAEKSVAEKAGLEIDDAIVSLDGEKVGDADDVRIFLLYKKQGDAVAVNILRKRFLFGERELRFEVTL